jgi:LysM repeat protein
VYKRQLIVAFLALVVSRLSASDAPSSIASASATPSPVATPAPTVGATPTIVPPSPTPTGTEEAPTASRAPSTAPTASSAPSEAPATYTVKAGDNLDAIATRFGTTVKVLIRLNGISDPSKIRVGQVLKLP